MNKWVTMAFVLATVAAVTSIRLIQDSRESGNNKTYIAKINAGSSIDISSGWKHYVLNVLRSDAPRIERNFDVQMPFLTLRFYATHREFGEALRKFEGESPQGGWDNLGNVVNDVLPVGPLFLEARHRLAHVYAEWVFNDLTHNTLVEPRPAWLYDGLAELEAQRMSPEKCELRGHMPLALSELSAPRNWWRVRGTGEASLEYCESETAAESLVKRYGWTSMVRRMKASTSWANFAQRL